MMSVFAAFVIPLRTTEPICARHPICIVYATHTLHSGGRTILALSSRDYFPPRSVRAKVARHMLLGTEVKLQRKLQPGEFGAVQF
ncbi:hypothetical protein BGY98DRAFT_1002171 [Russula aff. rugulosa BPL654]|nr:hypothetical protein BGY98DRAFT_1004719 [Russula aff. rugulosa BPL654]KAI0272195.1 hypothetical protein BGY98DRAFT_1002171 [Russula aff. rugulosa BPL654]